MNGWAWLAVFEGFGYLLAICLWYAAIWWLYAEVLQVGPVLTLAALFVGGVIHVKVMCRIYGIQSVADLEREAQATVDWLS